MGNKVVYGNKEFGYAPIVDTQGVKSFGTPVMMEGLINTNFDVNQEENKIYADDKVWATLKGIKERILTTAFRYIPSSYVTYLGYKATDNGGYTDNGTFAPHCLFYVTTEYDTETGIETPVLHYFYHAIAKQPTEPTTTKTDTIESAELGIEYDCQDSEFVVDGDGAKVGYFKIVRTTANATLFDSFKTAVILPTSEIPTPLT